MIISIRSVPRPFVRTVALIFALSITLHAAEISPRALRGQQIQILTKELNHYSDQQTSSTQLSQTVEALVNADPSNAAQYLALGLQKLTPAAAAANAVELTRNVQRIVEKSKGTLTPRGLTDSTKLTPTQVEDISRSLAQSLRKYLVPATAQAGASPGKVPSLNPNRIIALLVRLHNFRQSKTSVALIRTVLAELTRLDPIHGPYYLKIALTKLEPIHAYHRATTLLNLVTSIVQKSDLSNSQKALLVQRAKKIEQRYTSPSPTPPPYSAMSSPLGASTPAA